MTENSTTGVDEAVLSFPVERDARCPFDVPAALIDSAAHRPLRRARIWDGSTPWLVTGNAELRVLALDPRISTDDRLTGFPHWNAGRAAIAPMRPDSIFNTDGPGHLRLRRMMTRTFSYKRVEAQREKIQQVTDKLIDDMLAGPNPVDLVPAFGLPLPSFMICELLGVPYDNHDFFQEHASAAMDRYATPELQERLFTAMRGYMREVIEERLASSDESSGVISEFADNIRVGDMTIDEGVALANGLLSAGHETSAGIISLGTLALLQNPEQLEFLRNNDDPKAIANAVEELLRYLSIVHNGQRRIALEDIEISDVVIRAGDGVILDYSAGSWDARTFDEPRQFDVARVANKHLAFGFGPHGCIGQQLARVELQVAFATLIRRIPTLKLAVPIEQIEFKHDRLAYGVYSLPVSW